MRKLTYEELPEVNSPRWLSNEDLPGEEWRDVVDYEGLYMVSDYGRVKSLDRKILVSPLNKKEHKHLLRGRVLRYSKDKDGYWTSHLGRKHKLNVQRVVASAFILNPHNYPVVNHKDENKQNNCVYNLEWCTVKYNTNYGTGTIRNGEKHRKGLMQYSKEGKFIRAFTGLLEAESVLGIRYARAHIQRCCVGKKPSAYGYIWRYSK